MAEGVGGVHGVVAACGGLVDPVAQKATSARRRGSAQRWPDRRRQRMSSYPEALALGGGVG